MSSTTHPLELRTLHQWHKKYPPKLKERLRDKAPLDLWTAGNLELLTKPALGVIGSRDITREGMRAAATAGEVAANFNMVLVSGGARGTDRTSMNAAWRAGGEVISVLPCQMETRLRKPALQEAVKSGDVLVVCPYKPTASFTVWRAMGRNTVIYALADLTLVVACVENQGGSWAGATEALRTGNGRVAVWLGKGRGKGNAVLAEKGAEPVETIEDLGKLLAPARL